MSMLYEKEGYAIRGALFEVHRNLGIGFTEDVYQKAFEMELASCGIPFESQKEFTLAYKGVTMSKTFKADIVCYGKIIVELKAVKTLLPEHRAQLINYLRVSNLKMGLLVNFHSLEKLEIEPYINPYAAND